MEEKRGCFKTGCLGCLGVLALGVLFLGISALFAWRGVGNQDVVDRELTPTTETSVPPSTGGQVQGEATAPLPAGKGGKLVLLFGQGEFELHPGQAGQPLTIQANFDDDIYNLEDHFETLPDSTWVYQVRFYRTIGGMQALMRQIMGGGHDSRVQVYLPPDVPIELVIDSEEGGFEAELGGLWITSADIDFAKGGFSLGISDPLREPMSSLTLHSRMGGFEASGIGNASPAVLIVNASMGGADIALDGLWRNDCDADLSIKMGGMALTVPEDLQVEGVEGLAAVSDTLRRADSELPPAPVLRVKVSQSMGEVDISR